MIRATILIPAHNEATVIDRTLLHLSRGLPVEDFHIVVIANACTDGTAGKARAAMPSVTVIETQKAGKCHALNLGYLIADKSRPVVCLDADLDVTAESLLALIEPLANATASATCGRMDVTACEASVIVRAYYAGWKTNPYFDQGKFGGLYALSAEGARRVFPLPEITADDEYVRRRFQPSERVFVPECRFSAQAPRTLSSLLKVRRRSLRGAREVTKSGLPSPERASTFAVLSRMLRKPGLIVPVMVYAAVNTWVRLPTRHVGKSSEPQWERDMTSRVAG